MTPNNDAVSVVLSAGDWAIVRDVMRIGLQDLRVTSAQHAQRYRGQSAVSARLEQSAIDAERLLACLESA